MKKTIIITAAFLVVTLAGLIIFNKLASKKNTVSQFAEVSSGKFEITINTTGELVAQNSVDISGPAFTMGRDVRASMIKITDLVPEGTMIKKGDYVATLDKTDLDNALKDARDKLTTYQTNLTTALLDTAVTLANVRDQIINQEHAVAEAEMTYHNSKYETTAIIREAEISYERAKRDLEDLKRTYTLNVAQAKANIKISRYWLSRFERRVQDYEDVLAQFVIYSPSDGMLIYKKNRLGTKIAVGSMIDPFDRVVATIPDLKTMLSKAFVSEVEVNKVKIGQKAVITIDAYPDKKFTGTVMTVANIGEKLSNTDTKVFEVMIKIDGTDMNLRPAMTTNNKIMVQTFDNVTYIPNECIQTGADSIPVVYTKNGNRQVVVPGPANDKEIIIEKGLKPGMKLYLAEPEKLSKFKLTGEELIPVIRQRRNSDET